jgi:hypothetical protein
MLHRRVKECWKKLERGSEKEIEGKALLLNGPDNVQTP